MFDFDFGPLLFLVFFGALFLGGAGAILVLVAFHYFGWIALLVFAVLVLVIAAFVAGLYMTGGRP